MSDDNAQQVELDNEDDSDFEQAFADRGEEPQPAEETTDDQNTENQSDEHTNQAEADLEQYEADKQAGDQDGQAATDAEKQPDPAEDKIASLEKRLRNIEGRYGELKSVLASKTADEKSAAVSQAIKATRTNDGDVPTKAQINAALSSSEKFTQFADDFPEMAEALSDVLDIQRGSMDSQFVEIREVVRLDSAYPTWEDEVVTPEFADFLLSQPEDVQALAESDKAKDARKLMDAFYAHKAAITQKTPAKSKQSTLEAAISPTRGRGSAAPVKTDDDDFEAGFATARRY
jgi:hypothetical protein